MPSVMKILEETQSDCEEYGKWLKSKLPKNENFFEMLRKHAISAHEILSSIGNLRVKTEKEGNERIMLVLRSTWIFQLSVVEYAMKRIIGQSATGPLVDWYQGLPDDRYVKGAKRGLSLRGIVGCSLESGIINEVQHNDWIGLQDMRNAIVHNNAIIEESRTFKVGTFSRDIKEGEKVRSSHLDRAYFIRIIPSMSKSWLEGYLGKHNIA